MYFLFFSLLSNCANLLCSNCRVRWCKSIWTFLLLLLLLLLFTSVGAAAYAAELRKHVANDTRCQELGWTCIPLAVETCGNWGMEAQSVFSRLTFLLAIGQAIPKPKMLGDIYGHLNMSLVRSVARAIMGRENVQIS